MATYSLGGPKITPLITAYNPETFALRCAGTGAHHRLHRPNIYRLVHGRVVRTPVDKSVGKALARMPVVRSVAAVKQIIETILKQQSNAFRGSCYLNIRVADWAIGFAGRTRERSNLTADDVVNVFRRQRPIRRRAICCSFPAENW